MRRSSGSIKEAVARLNKEVLIPIEVIARELSLTKESVRRWGISGRRGVFLDVVHRPGRGWLTSRQALARFDSAVTAFQPAGRASSQM